jgi:hypothetical protein
VVRKVLPLSDVLDWFESLLDERADHVGERFTLFATGERLIEFHIDADELRVVGVTNFSLPHEQWLDEREVVKIAVMGWALDLVGGLEPRYIRRFAPDEPTPDIVTNVMRVFTSIYLGPYAYEVEVAQRVQR